MSASRPASAARPASSLGDGPITVLLLFGLALLIGVLVGVGARSWSRPDGDRSGAAFGDDRPASDPLSEEALALGYRSERHYAEDRRRAEAALRLVLASPPGTQRLWENVESGNRGVIWAAAETPRADGSACRRVERRSLVNEAFRNGVTTACHDPRGTWDMPQWQPG